MRPSYAEYTDVRIRMLEGTWGTAVPGVWSINGNRVLKRWGYVPAEAFPHGLPPGWADHAEDIDRIAAAHRVYWYERIRSADDCIRVLQTRPVICAVLEVRAFENPSAARQRRAERAARTVTITAYDAAEATFRLVDGCEKLHGPLGGTIGREDFDRSLLDAWVRHTTWPTDAVLFDMMPDLTAPGFRIEVAEVVGCLTESATVVTAYPESGGPAAGWASMVLREPYFDVEELFVMPEHRGHALGFVMKSHLAFLSGALSQARSTKAQLRLLVPFADVEGPGRPRPVRHFGSGRHFEVPPFRWAALVGTRRPEDAPDYRELLLGRVSQRLPAIDPPAKSEFCFAGDAEVVPRPST